LILGKYVNKPRSLALFLGIHELRIRLSGDQGRVLYFFCYRRFIVLTHAFVKTSAKVPRVEIKKAKEYRAGFLSRFRESEMEAIYDNI
jgi:phage-related protein